MKQALRDRRPTWFAITRRNLLRGALATTLAASVLTACDEDDKVTHWYGSWSAAPQDYNEPFPAPPPPSFFDNQTIRQVLRTSIGGDQVRVRFSNLFGTSPLKIDGARIALSAGSSSIKPASDTELRFNGNASATIPAGGELWSDAAKLEVGAGEDLAVSLFLATETALSTMHALGLQTHYVVAGNALSTETLSGAETRSSYYFISGVDVRSSAKANVVVAFGDSITDGAGTTPDTHRRWPDYLSRRLQSDGSAVSVLNAGIGGGRILTDAIGPSGVNRFERDVLGQTGVTHVIFLLGINDIGLSAFVPEQEVSVEQMTAGTQSLIDKAKAKGIKVLLGTLLPWKGANPGGAPYYSEAGEAKRQSFNAWIRANKTVDGVIDFDQALRDPADPLALLPAYDSGDLLHPNDKGAEAMANAVDIRLLAVQP
ncbi:SGNH/GDSL hydrolase family protein [Archangium lansingense]|uniref:SGNH/GDSL hydrolase family protein n=1 Tax=Archangium lansingense TaxID=2995310 RepID=A0ABT4A917_9BACT|nr:SGNH/GDSL hydrolase family protein [Archangium lansinium]MCY1078148.1 SGNH/GDSL hydrolase family protein [Archangium lansinium]